MNPIESMLYAACSDGVLYRAEFNVTNQGCNPKAWSPKHQGTIVSIAMVTKSDIGFRCGCVLIWDVDKGEVVNVLAKEHQSISSLVVDRDNGDIRRTAINL